MELDRYEREFWSDYQNYQLEIQSLGERQKSVKQQIKTSHELLTKLKRVNVYDDAFHISYDGHFGTISGFRLGRLMSQQVDWEETNAALGQVVRMRMYPRVMVYICADMHSVGAYVCIDT